MHQWKESIWTDRKVFSSCRHFLACFYHTGHSNNFCSSCLYISLHLHLYPISHLSFSFIFSCDLRTITWPFFPLSPLPACPSPLLITAYLEAPRRLVMESCIVSLTCEKTNQLCLSYLTKIQPYRVWKASLHTDHGLGDLQVHHS